MDSSVRWIDEKEVSRIIGLSVKTLQRNRLLGRGICYSKVGGSVRYRYSDVLRYMEDRLVPVRNAG